MYTISYSFLLSSLLLVGAGCGTTSINPSESPQKEVAPQEPTTTVEQSVTIEAPQKIEVAPKIEVPVKLKQTPKVEIPIKAVAPVTTEAPKKIEAAPKIEEPLIVKAPVKTFNVTARQWVFEPAKITVSQGDKVKLVVQSTDVAHGIGIPDFNVSSRLEPGKTTTLEFIADKTGTFSFFCTVFCGDGHSTMRGSLVVQ